MKSAAETPLPVEGLLPARALALEIDALPAPAWSWLELGGRLVEVASGNGGAGHSAALVLVVDAQLRGEPCVWIGLEQRGLFPPDAEAAGVDLLALAFVRVKTTADLVRAADLCARSGAFGLIVVDLAAFVPPLSTLSRLGGLARAHHTALVLLSEKQPGSPSLGSFVSLRADTRFERQRSGCFALHVEVDRDRRRTRPWRVTEPRRGPPGLS
ncbi:MAG: recombinase A [Planctomycetaceae bacterium]|nr:recombinase A [Planctomycetaceae bacterium]